MTPAAVGALLGLLAASGLLLAAVRTPWAQRVRLSDRLDPYLRDIHAARRFASTPLPGAPSNPLRAFVQPFVTDAARRLDRLLGGRQALTRRLERAGGRTTVEQFRIQQVLCGVLGAVPGAALLTLNLLTGSGPSPLVSAGLVVAGLTGGLTARDTWLTHVMNRREETMLAELPTVAELMALAVTAGESPAAAMGRVVRLSSGPLAGELGRALADVRLGMPLAAALDALARRTSLVPLSRFVDGVVVALERGTPLGDVLRAQAGDVREAGKRALLDAGGRKEIQMMIPVVFLVLPVTVVFATYPALVSLTFSSG